MLFLNNIKIALIVPPMVRSTLYGEWDLSNIDSVSPPMGLLSLAAMIRKYGGIPTIHDAYARKISLNETIKEVLDTTPDVIGVTSMTSSYPQAKLLIQQLKKNAPDIPIVMGGVHITALAEEVMEDLPELDFGVLKEGEITIVELLETIKSKDDFSKVNGLLYRSNNKILKTTNREFIKNLDILPPPAWDLLASLTEHYSLSIIGTRTRRATSLLTSRGCPGRCTFCDVGGVGRKIRGFSAEYVINMIDYLMTNYGINDFLVYDDNLLALRPRLKQICAEIITRRWEIYWSCGARVDMVDPEILKLMRKAGCWQIEYGIESGSQKTLDLMKKEIRLEQIGQALKWTKQAGIETRGNFIFGFLGETKETLEETIEFALKIDLDYFQQTFLTPYPGSEIYHEAEQYGKFDKDYEKMNNLTINFIPKDLTKKDLRYYSAKAFKKFYLRPRVIFHHARKVHNIKGAIRFITMFVSFLKTILQNHKVKKKIDDITLSDVKNFWERHPLLSYELPYEPGSSEFFKAYDEIREKIEFKYCFHLLGLTPELKGKKLLDIGCGNGWLLSQYAKYGLNTYGIDLTMRAVNISLLRFKKYGLKGIFINASAEELPFTDNSFDVVTSLGVIHHTPRTELCAKEIIRVCKPGGRVLIAVYCKNLFVKKWFYPLTSLGVRFLGRPDLAGLSRQKFINHYDGRDNPLGKVYSKKQSIKLVEGLENIRYEIHYFPIRFLPRLAKIHLKESIERFCDKTFGFLIYVEGYKPAGRYN